MAGGENVILLADGTLRYLTVREVARIMSFPDEWRIAGSRSRQMHQLGNAVPPRLAEIIARSVREGLFSSQRRLMGAVG